MGLSPITTGIPDVDRVRVESAAPASTWEVDSPPNDGVLTLTNSFDEPGELVEGARDVDERALTIREIASGRRPKVVTVHRSKNVAAESHVKERADLDSRERSRAAVEEWRPETMSDAWTVPVEDIAAIVICANGHRVSMGSLFCNFCPIERRMSIRWCSPFVFFLFSFSFSFSSPNSQPSSLREKGPSLR